MILRLQPCNQGAKNTGEGAEGVGLGKRVQNNMYKKGFHDQWTSPIDARHAVANKLVIAPT